MRKDLVLYIHGKGGSAAEREHYAPLFPDCEVVGLDYKTFTPWETGREIREAVEPLYRAGRSITLIANSIGAYLRYVRSHPVSWNVPTEILYGSADELTAYETIAAFAAAHRAGLTVMDGGEHWFHTPEQMAFLDAWIQGRQG